MTGVDMQHVPYRGGGPALIDVLAGQMPLMFETFATSIGHVQTGTLRALAVTAATRAPLLPDVPTIAETVPGYDAWGWQGIGAPKNTPTDIIERLNREIKDILADPAMKARIADLGGTVIPKAPQRPPNSLRPIRTNGQRLLEQPVSGWSSAASPCLPSGEKRTQCSYSGWSVDRPFATHFALSGNLVAIGVKRTSIADPDSRVSRLQRDEQDSLCCARHKLGGFTGYDRLPGAALRVVRPFRRAAAPGSREWITRTRRADVSGTQGGLRPPDSI